jgi:hypothetical protein
MMFVLIQTKIHRQFFFFFFLIARLKDTILPTNVKPVTLICRIPLKNAFKLPSVVRWSALAVDHTAYADYDTSTDETSRLHHDELSIVPYLGRCRRSAVKLLPDYRYLFIKGRKTCSKIILNRLFLPYIF